MAPTAVRFAPDPRKSRQLPLHQASPGPPPHGFAAGRTVTALNCGKNGRGERIRTSGPCLPKTVLYQAELLPDRNPLRCDDRSRREPRPRLDRGGLVRAQPLSAAEGIQPILDAHELLARGAGASIRRLRLLDPAP